MEEVLVMLQVQAATEPLILEAVEAVAQVKQILLVVEVVALE
jgi:hypothetical protein